MPPSVSAEMNRRTLAPKSLKTVFRSGFNALQHESCSLARSASPVARPICSKRQSGPETKVCSQHAARARGSSDAYNLVFGVSFPREGVGGLH